MARTLIGELRYLLPLARELKAPIELSQDDDGVLMQIVAADAPPLVGWGKDAPAAARALGDEIRRLIAEHR